MSKIEKKYVVVPNYLPKTTIEVDASLTGKELLKYIEEWKVRANTTPASAFAIKGAEIVGSKGMRNKELK